MLSKIRKLLGSGLATAIFAGWAFIAAPASAMLIADFTDDFASPAPSPGWSYLWNANGAIGTAANYAPLISNGSIYTTTGNPGLPNPAPGAFTLIGQGSTHPGPGTLMGASLNPISANGVNRYAIAAYTVNMAGKYSITNSIVFRTNPHNFAFLSPFGVELRVFINDMPPLFSSLVGTASSTDVTPLFFDMPLGQLNAGDVIYVAVGPNGSDQFDSANLDFTIEKAVPEPTTLVLFGLGLAGLGYARRRNQAA